VNEYYRSKGKENRPDGGKKGKEGKDKGKDGKDMREEVSKIVLADLERDHRNLVKHCLGM